MARAIHKLSAREVETFSKPGRHSDGGGLYLSISKDGRRRWTFMYAWGGKQTEAGLGSAGKGGASLKEARDKADGGAQLLVRAGSIRWTNGASRTQEQIPTFGRLRRILRRPFVRLAQRQAPERNGK